MVTQDHYPGIQIPELKVLLAKAIQQRDNGRIVELSVGGTNGVRTRRDFHDKHDPDLQVSRIRYAGYLRAIATGDQDLIAEWPNPNNARITRVRPNYHGFANS